MSINEDIKYLEENYGHKFPKIAKYKRTANRIYTIMDFMDGEIIFFQGLTGTPISSAAGYANYFSERNGVRLVNILELERIGETNG